MKTHLINIWDSLRSSYWFVPTALALAGLILGVIMPMVDEWVRQSHYSHADWIETTNDAARSTLSAILGAMVAVAGTVFSITIVTLSLTSQQYGPRLLRTFMLDIPTQLTLGVFLATALYCLFVLHVIEEKPNPHTAPHLSASLAIMLAVLSMAMLIIFIHHVSVMVQAPRVVEAVADELDGAISRLYPEKIGEPPSDQETASEQARSQEEALNDNSHCVSSNREGYIQAVDGEGVMELAKEHDLVIRLRYRPGDFIRRDAPLADVWEMSQWNQELAEHVSKRLNNAVLVGMRRTPRQDIECAIYELAEVAVRALSPGINDPFTAMNCIDRLAASLTRLANRKIPPSRRCDQDGRLRVIAPSPTFPDLMDAAFNQIRQYGKNSESVIIRLLEALEAIANEAERPEDKHAVHVHADMIVRSGERMTDEEEDCKTIRDRRRRVAKALGEQNTNQTESQNSNQ